MLKPLVAIPDVVVGEPLGRGAYSIVHRATYKGVPCALKLPHVRGRWTRWVYREAVALARVRHPGLPKVLAVGEVDELPYLLMELVEGETLADRLAHATLERDEVLELGCQLADTLRAVHDVGLVHRDVKPRNVILQESGRARLVDLGFVTPAGTSLVADAAGTRRYSAPEQFATPDRVDARADLYAVGRVLCECLIGRPPTSDDSAQALVDMTASGVPTPIARVVAGLLARAPADRYPDAAALLSELHRVRGGGVPKGPAACEAARVPGQLVGRRSELESFLHVWREVDASGGRVLVVEGISGAGKTRFVRTCIAQVVEEGRGRAVECTSRERDAPLSAVRRLFEGYIASLARLPPQERSAALTALRASASGPLASLACMVTPAFASVLGLQSPPPGGIPDSLSEGVAELVLRLARLAGPIVLSFDDLQWCDALSVEVLSAVAARCHEAPLLLLLATRTSQEGRGIWDRLPVGQKRPPVRVALGPLEARQSASLIAAHLGVDAVEPTLLKRIVAAANDTPAGLLEALGAHLDAGALTFRDDRWTLDPAGAERVVLPPGAMAYLGSRVDELPRATLRVLEAASILGTIFSDALLAGALELEQQDVDLALADGRRAGLLLATDDGRHAFAHDSIRELLSSRVDAHAARRWHQSAALLIAQATTGGAQGLYEAACHFELGEPERSPAIAHRSARAAAEWARERFDNDAALHFFDLASRWATSTSVLDVGFYRAIGECRLRVGALAQSLEAFEAALGAPSDAATRASICERMVWVRRGIGDTSGAWSALEDAFALLGVPFPKPDEPVDRAAVIRALPTANLDVLTDLCQQYVRLSFEAPKPLASVESVMQLLSLTKAGGASIAVARASATYASSLARLGRRVEASRRLSAASAIATTIGDPATLAFCATRRVTSLAQDGKWDEALQALSDAMGEYGPWFEFSEYCDTVLNGDILESARGRADRATGWIFRAVDRHVRRYGSAASVPLHILLRARAALATQGRAGRDPHGLAKHIAKAERAPTASQTTLLRACRWGAEARYLLDTDDIGEAFDGVARSVEADGHDPATCHPIIHDYFVAAVHVHIQRALRAPDRRPEHARGLGKAAEQLRIAARMPVYRAHSLMADAYLAWFEGSPRKAERLFAKAEALAMRETCPWVLWGVARGRAHMLRDEGKLDAARDQARVAEALAREHGAEPRARWVREEFGLAAAPTAPQQTSSSTSGARSSRRARQQLGTLLHIARAPHGELRRAQQASAIVDDLVRELGAERAYLLFDVPDKPQARIALGRTRLGETLPAPDGWRGTLMRGVMDRADPNDTGPSSANPPQDAPDRRRVLVAPLFLHERALGAVCVERGAAARSFDAEDHELLVMLGHQIPLGLELSRMLEERDELQATLQQTQKMEVVAHLAGGIAHDLNNMLTTSTVAAHALKTNPQLGADGRSYLRVIDDGLSRAAKLTQRLLTLSRKQPLTLAPVDVNRAVLNLEGMLRGLAGKWPGVDVVLDLDAAAHPAMTDEASFDQAVVNLFINARDALEGRGSIRITTRNTELGEDAVRQGAPAAGRYVTVEVTDTGSGMTPEVRARIFDPLFTTKPAGQGTGLGLTMVYAFVKHSGGHIDVESTVGEGTTFRIHLPYAERLPARRAAPVSMPMPAHATTPALILVVDDDAAIRELTRQILVEQGYRVVTAGDAADAIQLAQKNAEDLALVIMDLSMPDMSGQELGRRIGDLHLGAKMLYVSGYGRAALLGTELEDAPMLQKPFSSDILVGRVRNLLSH